MRRDTFSVRVMGEKCCKNPLLPCFYLMRLKGVNIYGFSITARNPTLNEVSQAPPEGPLWSCGHVQTAMTLLRHAFFARFSR